MKILDGSRTRLAGDTYVVFISDNGPTSFFVKSPILRGRKLQTFEGGLRCPASLGSGPDSPRAVCPNWSQAWDFYPTFAHWRRRASGRSRHRRARRLPDSVRRRRSQVAACAFFIPRQLASLAAPVSFAETSGMRVCVKSNHRPCSTIRCVFHLDFGLVTLERDSGPRRQTLVRRGCGDLLAIDRKTLRVQLLDHGAPENVMSDCAIPPTI